MGLKPTVIHFTLTVKMQGKSTRIGYTKTDANRNGKHVYKQQPKEIIAHG